MRFAFKMWFCLKTVYLAWVTKLLISCLFIHITPQLFEPNCKLFGLLKNLKLVDYVMLCTKIDPLIYNIKLLPYYLWYIFILITRNCCWHSVYRSNGCSTLKHTTLNLRLKKITSLLRLIHGWRHTFNICCNFPVSSVVIIKVSVIKCRCD